VNGCTTPERVIWTEPALKDLGKLDPPVARQVRGAVNLLAETGQGNLARLHSPLSGYRLRVRDWRVLLSLDRQAQTVTVRAIEHRSKVYKGR
jgi:mRNA-degrading endonuclease RelE of RelBE toxin-antitoxin system